MGSRTMLLGLCIAALITWASAQNKISGTAKCGKPDVQQKVDVPDHPGHAISVSQSKCTWTKPMEVAGIKSKEGVTTPLDDIHGDTAHSHGYYVDTMENGDKAFVSFQGSASMKDNTSDGKWNYTGGTGKLKGIKGNGTYKGKGAEDGSTTFDVEGEYTLPK
jgi:hypothetical protein